jgi:hypothetical protein
MGATVKWEKKGILVLHISGILRKEELDAAQAAALKELAPRENIGLLVIVDAGFRGWTRSEEWGDVSFFVQHGDRILKIAIVGEPVWEKKMLMFAGAGLRHAPVRYFRLKQLAEAKAWLD